MELDLSFSQPEQRLELFLKTPKQGHTVGLAIYIKKSIFLRQKEELWKIPNISPCKNIIFRKIVSKETKILQDIITL
jgi:hypothetical protein